MDTGGRAHAFAFLIEMEDQTNLVTDRRTGMMWRLSTSLKAVHFCNFWLLFLFIGCKNSRITLAARVQQVSAFYQSVEPKLNEFFAESESWCCTHSQNNNVLRCGGSKNTAWGDVSSYTFWVLPIPREDSKVFYDSDAICYMFQCLQKYTHTRQGAFTFAPHTPSLRSCGYRHVNVALLWHGASCVYD